MKAEQLARIEKRLQAILQQIRRASEDLDGRLDVNVPEPAFLDWDAARAWARDLTRAAQDANWQGVDSAAIEQSKPISEMTPDELEARFPGNDSKATTITPPGPQRPTDKER